MITDLNLDWTNIFKRNLLNCHENRLREFNLKLLYNILPIKTNLQRWGFTTDGKCTHCGLDEDNKHAFIQCDLNRAFFVYLTTIIRMAFHIDNVITQNHHLKTSPHTKLGLLLKVAFWCILIDTKSFWYIQIIVNLI